MKHYTIISGTGRAGTTLLVRILTTAGLDTGFDPTNLIVDPVAHAGLEHDLREKPDCYIVKSPLIATYIDQVFSSGEIVIDHAIICVRNIEHAAESRKRIQAIHKTDACVPGGLWETSDPNAQEAVLAGLFFRLIFHLSDQDVPMTFLHFPRFAIDRGYFVQKLSRIFPLADPERLGSAFAMETRPALITNFAQPETLESQSD